MKSMRLKSVLLLLAFAGVGVIGVISYLVLAATVTCTNLGNPCVGTNVADDITNPAGGLTTGQIRGLAGNDSIVDNRGGNTVTGDAGNDFIRINAGVDGTYGNSGNDTIQIGAGAGADQLVEMGDGNDNFIDAVGGHDGGAGATGCLAAAPATCIFGGGGNDSITTGVDGTGIPSNVDAGAGNDVVNITLNSATIMTGAAPVGAGIVRGGVGNDVITVRNSTGVTGAANNHRRYNIFGDAGNDIIRNNQLATATTAQGNQIFGGDGNDTLDCRGAAANIMPAFTAATDTPILFDGGFGNDTIFDCNEAVDSAEIIRGGPGNDRIILQSDDNDELEIDAGPGRDLIFVGANAFGAAAAPTPVIVCGPDIDTVFLDAAIVLPAGVTLPITGNTATIAGFADNNGGLFDIDASCENIRRF